MNITDAITRSESHTEIVHLDAATKDEAEAMIAEAKTIAEAAELEFDSTDTNDGYDLWACAEGSEKMEWRLKIKVGE